jgi:hypothetical protein
MADAREAVMSDEVHLVRTRVSCRFDSCNACVAYVCWCVGANTCVCGLVGCCHVLGCLDRTQPTHTHTHTHTLAHELQKNPCVRLYLRQTSSRMFTELVKGSAVQESGIGCSHVCRDGISQAMATACVAIDLWCDDGARQLARQESVARASLGPA